MANGKRKAATDIYLSQQESEWERTAQTLWMLDNVRLAIKATFSKVEASEYKDVDDFNSWLDVPGVDLPDAEKQKAEDAIIAERLKAAQEVKG